MNTQSKPAFASVAMDYVRLARLDKPIGIYLVLWPTLWALWFAAEGIPAMDVLAIFIAGSVFMRSAGCVINDFADRKIDGHVKRTEARPLVTGRVSAKQALIFFAVLCLLSFILVLFTNELTIYLSFGALALASAYPFMKRYTYLPQVVLGAAFAWSVPMAYAAQVNELPAHIWLIYMATVLWTVAYDTMYAMVDRDDDIKIGVKSTAILFGSADRAIIAFLQVLVILTLSLLGEQLEMGQFYFLSIVVASVLFVYQQHLIRHRDRDECFKAFLNNNWVGMVLFLGLFLDFYVR
ncbi:MULTISPECIES: 4-hydroxybenzoate octaprenyltransferase [unclassified Oleiphilus]|jgi:4-hydroxybenzoate polyprenyltransferase|nr:MULTISPECIES: 4-hydroxybenzoate octaprenyltransferase [unclassified Oleiphilus]KZY44247.1 4-hydroxybenzoate octaprenyltransferase [Oleiphilus sp. HI0050]KZY77774.1 4-hydroxybenzoate octaprenyltransferase [Oleiphilus sp. HI0068]KZY83319.1 4-hydroxybenzoate octaprenyltransferase [Oleiphilus sp. HI0069]KZZ15940.1 4-hydroxybenzoate octaprenyltransferase [Oleiphilus sp. HI0078]KZZ41212.1 4-hydroxybenzoate octaprenyltransferase [Oleiphilus sp. HI0085]